jgi:hypothetical protein
VHPFSILFYPIVAADALLDISTADIAAPLSLDELLSQILPVARTFVYSRCIVVLLGRSTSLSDNALLIASRTAPNDFDVK